jgi:membrane protein YqaA with SNARE-associated domain
MLKIIQAPFVWTRQLYDWVLKWGESPHSQTALFFLALAEASFFPIAPDTLLIALCMSAHRRWVRFAIVCSVGSVIGGVVGYLIGHFAYDVIGHWLLEVSAKLAGTEPSQLLQQARYWFNEKELWGLKVGPWAVGIAGFTPIPYKVFTIAAGFFEMAFVPFVVASAISRSLRFFVVAGITGMLYRKYGDKIKDFIDKYFNLLAVIFVVLLIGGFMAIRWMRGD